MKEHFLWTVSLLTGFASSLPFKSGGYSVPPTLAFRSDGTFKIAVFEDLHYGEGEANRMLICFMLLETLYWELLAPELGWGPVQDVKSTKVMNTILDAESPDFVVLNGDLITGENTYIHNSTAYLDIIVGPMVSRNTPWASAYGNHDNQFNLSTVSLLQREQSKFPNLSLTTSMIQSDQAGVSNYYLPVYSYNGKNPATDVPACILWFFDSKGGKEFQKTDSNGNIIQIPGVVDDSVSYLPGRRTSKFGDGWGSSGHLEFIKYHWRLAHYFKQVVTWFVNTNAQLVARYNRTIPSLAFVHIPTNAMAAFQKQGVDAHKEPGINEDNPLAQQGVIDGTYAGTDVPFMSALVGTKGLMAAFSGHDHGDDW
jgi:hypothetical protein